jgi:predicted AlkP superfamily phosphohydrolase/phosphomutase
MEKLEWEVFMTVFRASDGIFHTHPEASDAHREIFRRIDRHVGEMRHAAGEDANLFVVSDHGMTRLAEVVHLNALFLREGLLARRDVGETLDDRAVRFVDRVKTSALLDNPIVKNPIARRAAEALRQRRAARTLEFGREGRRQPRLSEALVEWSRTVCFFVDLGYGSGVYLNLAGREPLGIVDARDYEATRERVRALLERQADVVVMAREEVYAGPFVDRAPDLLVTTNREEVGLSGRLLDTPVRTKVDVPYFHHTSRGIVAAAGPDVRAGARFEPFEIVDILPTVLHLLGVPVPSDVDGVVRRELFRDESSATREPLFVDAMPLGDPEGIDPYDDEAIKEKLRGLGYMH